MIESTLTYNILKNFCKFKNVDICDALGVHYTTVSKWATGKGPIPQKRQPNVFETIKPFVTRLSKDQQDVLLFELQTRLTPDDFNELVPWLTGETHIQKPEPPPKEINITENLISFVETLTTLKLTCGKPVNTLLLGSNELAAIKKHFPNETVPTEIVGLTLVEVNKETFFKVAYTV